MPLFSTRYIPLQVVAVLPGTVLMGQAEAKTLLLGYWPLRGG